MRPYILNVGTLRDQLTPGIGDESLPTNISKKSPTGPTDRTPKPEYLIARLQLTERGPLGFGPIQFLMD